MNNLPTNLKKSPLIYVALEIHLLNGDILIEKLDELLVLTKFKIKNHKEDVIQLGYKSYKIFLGKKSLAITTSKYISRNEFKKNITDILNLIEKAKTPLKITQVSLKKVNFLPQNFLSLNLHVGKNNLSIDKQFLFSFALKDENTKLINKCRIASSVALNKKNQEKETGFILDITSSSAYNSLDFYKSKSNLLDTLHNINKKMFFNMITNEALEQMEPDYDNH